MLNTLTRKDQLKHMEEVDYDIVVIGGGITGAGIALDASKRGMKVALVEMQDFAEGTSSDTDTEFTPDMEEDTRNSLYSGWQTAVQATQQFKPQQKHTKEPEK